MTRANVGGLLHCISAALFLAIAVFAGAAFWEAYRNNLGAELIGWTFGLVVLGLLGTILTPVLTGLSVYVARELYYYDSGKAVAAVAVRGDSRVGHLAGDMQGYAFGAWPKRQGGGGTLASWLRAEIHQKGGRLTGTALPAMARRYVARGMFEDGRTARFLVRVASRPRP